MDLSDFSDFEDIMIKSSDQDIPVLEDAPFSKTLVCIEHYVEFKLLNLYPLLE